MYRIGDFYVNIVSKHNHIVKRAEKYKIECEVVADFQIIPDRYAQVDSSLYPDDNIMEYCLLGDNFAEKVLEFDAVVIHASAIAVDDNAYLFSAVGGTGKSTHTGLWENMLLNSSVMYINDDKPLLRILDNNIMTYGTPFSGKTDKNSNMCVPLKAICFLVQDKKNWIRRLTEEDAITKFIAQTLKGISEELKIKLKKTVKEIVKQIPMYEMGCKPELEAAKISHEVMSGVRHLDVGDIYGK